jgi:hypothetical protein
MRLRVFSFRCKLLNQSIDFRETWCESWRMRSHCCLCFPLILNQLTDFCKTWGEIRRPAIIMISVFSTRCEPFNQWIDFRKTGYESVAIGGQPSPLSFIL